jgi:hypothetical protein
MLGPNAGTLRACPDFHNRHEPSLRMAGRWPLVLRTSNVVPNRSEPLDAPTPKPVLTMDLISRTILGYTAEVVGVSPDDILSEVKTQELVLARSIFADIAYSEYLYTYCQIGRIIKRNHATVMHNLEILAINMRARPDIKFLRTQVLNRTRDFLQH